MKKYLITLVGAALLVSTIGCANGPLRQWRRGAPCNTCNPQIQQPLNVAPSCNSGCAEDAVGTGFMSRRWFRGNNGQQQASCGTGACGTGAACPTGNCLPPTGGQFANEAQGPNLPMMIDSAAPGAVAPGNELYGNASNTVGRLEMPPISFGGN